MIRTLIKNNSNTYLIYFSQAQAQGRKDTVLSLVPTYMFGSIRLVEVRKILDLETSTMDLPPGFLILAPLAKLARGTPHLAAPHLSIQVSITGKIIKRKLKKLLTAMKSKNCINEYFFGCLTR